MFKDKDEFANEKHFLSYREGDMCWQHLKSKMPPPWPFMAASRSCSMVVVLVEGVADKDDNFLLEAPLPVCWRKLTVIDII
ncbi:hypothetical protein E2C01_017997 [Portunus trituberculatus]|uniref:Uncharacterized protein n=1 Tax=Portunus trituberculatus TaxID=210409 RepID=A0A5B7DVB4_PORTR|nr:hypothetical protein [Portunus trituberculatus]